MQQIATRCGDDRDFAAPAYGFYRCTMVENATVLLLAKLVGLRRSPGCHTLSLMLRGTPVLEIVASAAASQSDESAVRNFGLLVVP